MGSSLTTTTSVAAAAAAKSLQSCPTLCNPIDGSPPGSPVPGILQARTLEWVAISFSKLLLLVSGKPKGDQPGRRERIARALQWLFFKCSSFGLPREFSGKESACYCRKLKRQGFDPWVRKIPWRRAWQPTPVFLPGESHGQRSLVGCSPWGSQRAAHN